MSKKYSPELKRQVIEAVKQNPDMTYAEIAIVYDVQVPCICLWAKEAGVARRLRKSVETPQTVETETPQPDEVDLKIQRLEQQLAEARRFKEETEIRFEYDANLVYVYGLGAKPLVAEFKLWLRFLSKNGAALLRQFIEATFLPTPDSQRVQ